MDKHKIK